MGIVGTQGEVVTGMVLQIGPAAPGGRLLVHAECRQLTGGGVPFQF